MIRSRWLVLLGSSLVVAACGGSKPAAPEAAAPTSTEEAPPPPAETAAPGESAPADGEAPAEKPAEEQKPVEIKLAALGKSKLAGTLRLEPVPDGVKVMLHLTGVKAGKHGAHIHEMADCSAKDGKSAGGHFNPDGNPHALPPTDPRHLGDLGNIEIDKKGEGDLEIVINGANLIPGDKHSFLDRGIIVHEKKDDGGQPTGNAGGRIGCGEIKM
jgi:superoxide dismutase, Cu-Zn family